MWFLRAEKRETGWEEVTKLLRTDFIRPVPLPGLVVEHKEGPKGRRRIVHVHEFHKLEHGMPWEQLSTPIRRPLGRPELGVRTTKLQGRALKMQVGPDDPKRWGKNVLYHGDGTLCFRVMSFGMLETDGSCSWKENRQELWNLRRRHTSSIPKSRNLPTRLGGDLCQHTTSGPKDEGQEVDLRG